MVPEHGFPSVAARRYSRLICVLISIACGFAPHEAAAQCRIVVEHARLTGVMVSAPGVRFFLDLGDVPLTVEPKPGKRNASVQVTAPLRFTASYPTDKLPLRIKQRVDLHSGRIRLGEKAGFTWLGVRGDDMQLSLTSTLGIEAKVPLQIPCSHLGLSDGPPYQAPEVVWPPENLRIGTGSSFFPLYLGSQEVDPLQIRYAGPFKILGKQPGWVQLEAAWTDGSRVTGWTLERHTTSQVAPVERRIEGQSERVGRCSERLMLAKFTLREQAPIAVSPGGSIWAWAARTVTVDAIPMDRSDGWIQVIGVPGWLSDPCSEYEHIWVHARDVVWTSAPAKH